MIRPIRFQGSSTFVQNANEWKMLASNDFACVFMECNLVAETEKLHCLGTIPLDWETELFMGR